MLTLTCLCVVCGWLAERHVLKRRILELGLWAPRFEDRLEVIQNVSRKDVGRRGASALIYALGDPDLRVGAAADQALRRISGKADGVGDFIQDSEPDRLKVTARWIEWYLSGETSKQSFGKKMAGDVDGHPWK